MKAFTVAAVVGCVLVAGYAVAQQPAPAQQAPPTQQAKPATPAPAAPAAQAPAAQAPAAPVPEPKFPDGAKFAYLNIQRIAAESGEGKTASARIEAARQKKASDLSEKTKAVETLQAKQRSSTVSDDARAQAQKEIDKLQVEIQRMTQDAQAELQDLQNELQVDFQRKVAPIIQQIAVEKGVQMLFSQTDSGLVWAVAELDLTTEVIRRFDAATAVAPKPAAPAVPKK